MTQVALMAVERIQPVPGGSPSSTAFETCLLEVAIRCQSALYPALFHHLERQAVRQAPILVASCLVKTHSRDNRVGAEGHNFDLRILVTSPVAPAVARRVPEPANAFIHSHRTGSVVRMSVREIGCTGVSLLGTPYR